MIAANKTRAKFAGVAVATALGAALAFSLVDTDGQMPEPTVIRSLDLKENTGEYVDRAGAGEHFIVTRSGVPTADLVDTGGGQPTTTTSSTTTSSTSSTTSTTTSTTSTTTSPSGAAYPLVTSPDFQGDFDPDCDKDEWSQVYNERSTTTVQPGGPFGCYARMTSQGGGGGVRAELGTPTLPAGSEWTSELLIYIPSSTDYTGFVSQHKQEETAGSCAQGGWSFPSDERRLLLRVRSDCDADYRDLDFGAPPRDRWIALWTHGKSANSGGFFHARVDPDANGPAPYGAVKTVTGDTSAGGTVKVRVGAYGSMPSGDQLWVDEYRRDNG
jgi:antitoxin (DNA-binding transcriptional repressor) of toxin-antitoxin stability system